MIFVLYGVKWKWRFCCDNCASEKRLLEFDIFGFHLSLATGVDVKYASNLQTNQIKKWIKIIR